MSVLERWYHKVHEIPSGGVKQHREASAELRAELAVELGVPACNSLVTDYRIINAGRGRFELRGRVQASFTRTCVITLEPMVEVLNEPLDCAFVPRDRVPREQADEELALSVEDLEVIEHDRIDVGRVVYEVVAASLDPYPRSADAAVESAAEEPDNVEPAEHPFAVLAELKKNEGDSH